MYTPICRKRPCDSPSSSSFAKRQRRNSSGCRSPPSCKDCKDDPKKQPIFSGYPKQKLEKPGFTSCACCNVKSPQGCCDVKPIPILTCQDNVPPYCSCNRPTNCSCPKPNIPCEGADLKLLLVDPPDHTPWYERLYKWISNLVPQRLCYESNLVEKNCFDKISEQALRNFVENNDILTCAEEKCAAFNAVLETWNAMPASQKVRYYWEALEHGNIKSHPFKNFFNLYKCKSSAPRSERKNRARNAWKKLTFNQKLPFIVESLIAKMIVRQTDIDEKFIKQHFERYRTDTSCECD